MNEQDREEEILAYIERKADGHMHTAEKGFDFDNEMQFRALIRKFIGPLNYWKKIRPSGTQIEWGIGPKTIGPHNSRYWRNDEN